MKVGELRHRRPTSLSLPGRPIQRKRVHRLSTCAAAALAAALGAGGCAGRGSGSGTGGDALGLSATPATISLAPNQQGTVRFRLDNGGVPVAGRTVSFTITDGDPAGATLASSSAVTDASGITAVKVRAGLATMFDVEAHIGSSSAQVAVIVQAGDSGTVVVAPLFATTSDAPQQTSSIRVLFYDGKTCAEIDPDNPPVPFRDPVPLALGDSTVSIPAVSTGSTSAVFVEALGPGPTILAVGCVDVLGSTVLASGTVEVAVPLVDAVPDPVGTFAVTSTFTFTPPLAAAGLLAARWSELSDCPLDPAQLWLDCTVDALSTTAADPVDCVPSTAPGGEGQLGDAIAARRGAWLTDGTGAALACRATRAPDGSVGLDGVVQGLFGSPTPAPLLALPGIASDAASILSSVRLASTLAVAPATQPGTYAVTHTLQAALFGPGWTVSVLLAPLGLPVLQAVTSATIENGALNIAQHGFTLRLGSAARAAFGPLALAPRGFPSDVSGFVGSLFGNAKAATGASGCDALDAAVCTAVSRPTGCLVAACTAGLTALAARLDAAFAAADGPDTDLTLTGTAPMVAVPGGLRAHYLGVGEIQSSRGATWNATVRTSLGSSTLPADFQGVRN
ncbi:MAG TPA: Ig-like domain-containing protein [Polyangia bacterium]|nr:Ig-like domain-containing protein [Polyangia bacterium]